MTHPAHRKHHGTESPPPQIKSQERGRRRVIPKWVIEKILAEQDYTEWAATLDDPQAAELTHSVAKGRNRTQLCYGCHEPIGLDRLRLGTPDPLRQSAEYYCKECFKTLNIRTVR